MPEVPKVAVLDEAALTSLQGALRAFVRRRVGSAAEAEDLVQEAFVRLYAAGETNSIGQPQAYLFRVAANLVVDYRRKAATPLGRADCYEDRLSPIMQADQDASIRQRELQSHFEQALAELPARQRQVFIMSRFEEESTLSIALQLRITRRMVQKHLILAVSHLYKRLRPHMDEGR